MLCDGPALIPLADPRSPYGVARDARGTCVRAVPGTAHTHAEHVSVLLDNHLFSDRWLLVAPNHERRAVVVGEKTAGDIRLQARYAPRPCGGHRPADRGRPRDRSNDGPVQHVRDRDVASDIAGDQPRWRLGDDRVGRDRAARPEPRQLPEPRLGQYQTNPSSPVSSPCSTFASSTAPAPSCGSLVPSHRSR
jgi:hypothetical protein